MILYKAINLTSFYEEYNKKDMVVSIYKKC